jgi:SH3 domain protein
MRTLLTALLLLLAAAASAETRYVDDKLVITMRTGQGTTYQILKTLPSGSKMELLQDAGKYSQVRTEDGTEGWVLTQYLSATPIARDQLARAEQKLQQLQEDKRKLQQRLSETGKERDSVSREHKALSSEADKLHSELKKLREVAARPIELAQENSELKDKLDQLQKQNQLIEAENNRLRDRSERDWFMTGAGVLTGGIFLGLVLPMLRRRKKGGMFD